MQKQAPLWACPHVMAIEMCCDLTLKTRWGLSVIQVTFLKELKRPQSFSVVTFVIPAGILSVFLIISFQVPYTVDLRQKWLICLRGNLKKRVKGSRMIYVKTKQLSYLLGLCGLGRNLQNGRNSLEFCCCFWRFFSKEVNHNHIKCRRQRELHT